MCLCVYLTGPPGHTGELCVWRRRQECGAWLSQDHQASNSTYDESTMWFWSYHTTEKQLKICLNFNKTNIDSPSSDHVHSVEKQWLICSLSYVINLFLIIDNIHTMHKRKTVIYLYSIVYTQQEHSNLPVPDHIHTTGTQCLNKLPERRKMGKLHFFNNK